MMERGVNLRVSQRCGRGSDDEVRDESLHLTQVKDLGRLVRLNES